MTKSFTMVIIPAAISLLQSLISSMPLFKLRPSAYNRYRYSDYPCSTPFTGISLKASLSCSMVIIPAAISLLQSLISSIPLFKLRLSACNRNRSSDYPYSTPLTGMCNNPNVDLVNMNAYIKFGEILSICSQDIERLVQMLEK